MPTKEIIKQAESNYPCCIECTLFECHDVAYIKNPRNCMLWLRNKNGCPNDSDATAIVSEFKQINLITDLIKNAN